MENSKQKQDKQDKQEFVGAKRNQHFKLDKQTKRMMASLGKYGPSVKLNAQEQKEAEVKLENLTVGSFKKLMIEGQLSTMSASLSGLRDPLWKPKKEKVDQEEGEEGQKNGKFRKGKRAIKMRKPTESAQQE